MSSSGVARRKAQIVLVLLKRHGLVREHRGGSWERLRDRLTQVDLRADLTDYEERRARDQAKLQAVIDFAQAEFLLEAHHDLAVADLYRIGLHPDGRIEDGLARGDVVLPFVPGAAEDLALPRPDVLARPHLLHGLDD